MPPVHDSATASVSLRASRRAPDDRRERRLARRVHGVAEPRAHVRVEPLEHAAAPVVARAPPPSPGSPDTRCESAASRRRGRRRGPRSAWSTCDSPMPATRQVRLSACPATDGGRHARRHVIVEDRLHLARHTRHRRRARALPTVTPKPGASPGLFSSTSAPAGTRTWRSVVRRHAKAAGREALLHLVDVRRVRHGRDAERAPLTTSTVRSSSVGPSPPEVDHASARVQPPPQRRRHVGRVVGDRSAPAHVRAECT